MLAAAPTLGLAPARAGGAAAPLHVEVARKARALAAGRALSLRLLLPRGSEANVAPVIDAFTRMTGIGVEMVLTDVDEINSVLALHTLGGIQRYDMALPATHGLPDLVNGGALRPLTDFARRHEPEGFRDDILFSTGDSFDGQIYGFQTDGDAYMMFYNREMLDDPDAAKRYAARFGHPLGVPRTWVELDRQMEFFHAPEEGRYGGLLFRTPGYVAWEFWVRFHARGVWPMAPDLTPQINGADGAAALRALVDATRWQCPETSHLGLFGNWERFARGDVYCNLGWGGSQKYFNAPGSPLRGRLAYGPTPGGERHGEVLSTPYFNWGWNYVITAGATEPEIAYLFALFASSPEISNIAVSQQDGFFDPFRPENYTNPDIQKAYSAEFLKVHRASMAGAIPDLYLENQSGYFRVLGEEIMRTLNNEESATRALDRVAEQWNFLSLQAGTRRQSHRWQRLRAKYPPAVRTRLRDL